MHILAYMYICIYFTCTHNLFKLQPLLDWSRCRQLVNAFQIWQLTMRSQWKHMIAEKRQYRNKTQSQENKTQTVSPPPLPVVFTNSRVWKNPDTLVRLCGARTVILHPTWPGKQLWFCTEWIHSK